jgi:diacylglycerol kinase (ATP)
MADSPSEPRPPYRAPSGGAGLGHSFVHAWNGLVHTVVHQRNMRVHLTAAILVGLVGSGIPLGLAEKVTLVFCVLLVFFAEILNSALEQLVDLATLELHPNAGLAKDAAAAGVLVLAIGTVVIFAVILFHNLPAILASGDAIVRQLLLGVPLTLCAVILMTGGQRPPALDATAAVGALALWALTLPTSTSSVFSAMTLGMLVVAGAAALERRAAARRGYQHSAGSAR